MSKGKNKVTVIGLGAMGAELARVLLRNNYDVTVWNRTAAKAGPLVDEGATLAEDAAAAVDASPIIINCVYDYKASHDVFRNAYVKPLLKGKLLIELTTGTPDDARESAAWAKRNGIEYIDGAIMATPSQMGRPETTILASGPREVFEKAEPVLRALAGNLTYTGDAVGNAAALDFAILSAWFGGILGFVHGARICEAEGLRIDEYGSIMRAIAPIIGEQNAKMAENMQAGNYDNSDNTIKICADAMELIARHSRSAQISPEFPEFAAGVFNRAVDLGLGAEGLSALIKSARAGIASSTAA